MAQSYRIYINDNVVMITDKSSKVNDNVQLLDSQSFDFQKFYNKVKNKSRKQYLLAVDAPKLYFKTICKTLKLIEAAGGMVKNDEKQYLFIFRNGKWDLPKGKIELGEKTKVAAVREVQEECNVLVDKVGKKICRTYHIYELKGKLVIKKTHWYKMKVEGHHELVPQLEEGITAVEWLPVAEFDKVRLNTYPSILEVLSFIETSPVY